MLQQLDPVLPKSRLLKFPEVTGTGLGHRIEECIPAADIGAKRMFHPDPVPQMDSMTITGASAVGMILALGEKRGKDAMLHVKHRHVLMNRQFEPCGGSRAQEIQYLCDIEIIADGHAIEAL